MENASKALIIAGAILISIVLITIGVVIMQQGSDVVDEGGGSLDKTKIEAFNKKFSQYEGERVSGSQVKALINAVNASNSGETNDGGDRHITLTGSPTTVVAVKNASKYKIEVKDYDAQGYISKIEISSASSSGNTTP